MLHRLAILLCVLFLAAPLAAQTADPCAAPSTTGDTVYSGRPYPVTWQMQAQVPVSATDPTLIPQRIDGFFIGVDGAIGAARLDTGKLTPVTCPSGQLGFKFTVASGVAKGAHSVIVYAYNFVLDATGSPTTTRQEVASPSRPFVAVDLVQSGPPQPPSALRVWPR